MITLNQTPDNDNKLIVFIRIYFDDTIYKIANKETSITGYNNNIIEDLELVINNQNESHDKGLVIPDDFELKIPRYLKNDYLSDYQNAFYPNTGKTKFYKRKVEVGIGWEGIMFETQITWIYKGVIKEFQYDTIEMSFTIGIEFDNIEVPTEKFNRNEYPNIPEENAGKVKPIVFGMMDKSFLWYETGSIPTNIFNYHYIAPAILVDKTKALFFVSQFASVIIPNNKALDNGGSQLYKYHIVRYEEEVDLGVAYINNNFTDGAIIYNDANGYRIQLLDDTNGVNNNIIAYFKYCPRSIGRFKAGYSEKLILRNAGNDTYIMPTLTNFSYNLDELAPELIGVLNNLNVAFVVHCSTGTSNLELKYYDKTTSTFVDLQTYSTTNLRTTIVNAGNLYNKLNGNYELVLRWNSLTTIWKLYIIGFNTIATNSILFD